MANTNTPFGLKLLRGGAMYEFNSQGNLYSIPTSDSSNAYYLNDAVKLAASGDANGVPNVVKAAGTDILLGSIQGILPVYPGVSIAGTALSLETTNIPATKAPPYYVIVADDPTAIYAIQDDGITTGNLVAASCNLNSSLTITAGASTTSPSATVLLSSSFAATNTLNIHLQGLVQGDFSGVANAYGAFAKWQARLNIPYFAAMGVTGATGV